MTGRQPGVEVCEQANLAHDNRYRAERQRLIQRLRQWVADTGDKFNIPAD